MSTAELKQKTTQQTVAILDTGAGNITSLAGALKRLGAVVSLVADISQLSAATKLVIPGQGRFGRCAQKLQQAGQFGLLKEWIEQARPTLGICVGMQLLLEGSAEDATSQGLGVIQGALTKLDAPRVPLMGWLPVAFNDETGFSSGDAYFVNSYCARVDAVSPEAIAATSQYFQQFASAVRYKNTIGMQFHPEKSAEYGLELLSEWLRM